MFSILQQQRAQYLIRVPAERLLLTRLEVHRRSDDFVTLVRKRTAPRLAEGRTGRLIVGGAAGEVLQRSSGFRRLGCLCSSRF
jgi:hypothetical protein